MESLGYQSFKADEDLWLKPEIRPDDGVKYYYYLFFYVGHFMHHYADSMLEQLHKSLLLK